MDRSPQPHHRDEDYNMGSISYARPANTTPQQEALNYLQQNLYSGHTIVAHSVQSTGDGRNGEWSHVLYAAVDDGTGSVTAHVLLFSAAGGDIHIKCLHEEVGPAYWRAVPKKLLAALTTTTNEYALTWRSNAARWTERRAVARRAIGSQIRLARPLTYGQPVGEISEVHIESMTMFRPSAGTGPRMTAPFDWFDRDFTVIA
jgi:hypothetical protein